MKIKGLGFVKTCDEYPEQYDVYDYRNRIVGYVKLRWGHLKCEYPDVGGKVIYSTSIGDELVGAFENEKQRELHLNIIADTINNHIATDK